MRTVAPPPAVFVVGDRVRLVVGAGRFQKHVQREGQILLIEYADRVWLATVLFDPPSGSPPIPAVRDIPTSYLVAVKAPRRRSPLTLTEPPDKRSERAKQDEAVKWLTNPDQGYHVLVAGQYIKKVHCEDCGTWFWPRGFGNSVGFPDVAVGHPTRWVKGAILFLEFKQNERSERRPEQIALTNLGLSTFVWTMVMVVDAILDFEARIGVEQHPKLLARKAAHS